jgi:hypothetical protein
MRSNQDSTQRLSGRLTSTPCSQLLNPEGKIRHTSLVLSPITYYTTTILFILTNLYNNYINPLYIYIDIYIGYALLSHLHCYSVTCVTVTSVTFDTVVLRKLVLYAMA